MKKLNLREIAVMTLSLLFAGIGYFQAESMTVTPSPNHRAPHLIAASVTHVEDLSHILALSDYELERQ